MSFYTTWLNTHLVGNPAALLITGTIMLAVFHIIKNIAEFYWNKYSDDTKMNHESHLKLVAIEKHLSDMNGSIKKHHDDKEIHFTDRRLMTTDRCHAEHEKFNAVYGEKLDRIASEIFNKIDALSQVVYEQKGASGK